MNNKGFTLVEMMIVVAIVGILTIALAFQFAGWKGKYNVEKTIKDIYSSLNDSRARAMEKNRAFFFEISPDGRHYRVTDDDSNGAAKTVDGDGIYQEQRAWNLVEATVNVNANLWDVPPAVAVATDTTIPQLSRRLDLPNNAGVGAIPSNSPRLAGLMTFWWITPQSNNWTFRLGFDKRGVVRNMILPWPLAFPSPTNIQNAMPFDIWLQPPPQGVYGQGVPGGWGNPTICIFTDYDGNGTSDSDPDYDCIVVRETKISIGKLVTQNTPPGNGLCREANCVVK